MQRQSKHTDALLLAALVVACALAACGGKRESETIIAPVVAEEQTTLPVRMQDYKQRSEVEWNGQRVECIIERVADDSLQMVADERGQLFVDNRVTLEIRRADGGVMLKTTFTKERFAPWLDDDYRATGIVEGFVFDRVEGSTLRFAASVCHPQTDEYIPLVVSVEPGGSVQIERDTMLDTSGE